MKLKVNPLVVAAALGLLGPAALAEDDDVEQDSLAGVWKRSPESRPQSTLALGNEIQVVPFDGTVMLDDGMGGPQGTWQVTDRGPARQELVVDGSRVTRTFEANGDRLDVHVTVESGSDRFEYSETFVREG